MVFKVMVWLMSLRSLHLRLWRIVVSTSMGCLRIVFGVLWMVCGVIFFLILKSRTPMSEFIFNFEFVFE